MCSMHYLRWRRYGRTDLLESQPRRGATPSPAVDLSAHPRQHWVIWAAGFFDGEGCIVINYRKKTRTHFLKLSVPQVAPAPVRILQGIFGGCFRNKVERLRSVTHRRKYVWEVTCGQAADALKEMLPYLIGKREEAQVAIEFQAGIFRAIKGKVSDAERLRRDTLRLKIQELKWREYEEV
jgi:hypothetical protein